MQHYFEMLSMKFIDNFLRIRKVLWMPREFAVVSVPARWREVRAEVDQRVAGQLLFTERARNPVDLVRSRESAMRLQVSKAPQRWQFRFARQSCIRSHN